MKGPKFESIQRNEWIAKLKATHEAQRESLLLALHGSYSDPSMSEEARLNALALGKHFAPEFTASTKSQMIDRHSGYRQAGEKTGIQLLSGFSVSLTCLTCLTCST